MKVYYIMSNILTHKPNHTGDLDDEFLNYIIEAYNNDELREDNYQEFSRHLNDILNSKKNDKDYVDSVRKIFNSVSHINKNDEEEKN